MRYAVPVEPADLLRSVRRRQRITQAELARRAGTSQPVISAYERGHRDPTYRTLLRLVEAGGERLRIDSVRPPADLPPPVDVHDHAYRLGEVLGLAEAFPFRRSGPLVAPRLVSR
jgi:transcriptional regulator with XRE-family HTH domain